MSVQTEVFADGKGEILYTVNSFKGVTIEPVYSLSLISFVGADMNDLTFFWVELHGIQAVHGQDSSQTHILKTVHRQK